MERVELHSRFRQSSMMQEVVAKCFAAIRLAIENEKIPGAVLGLIDKNGARAIEFGGLALKVGALRAMARDTVFDLASLTKVIFTTNAIMSLVAKRQIALDDPLSKFIPDIRQYDLSAPERQLTIEQCLTHQTFLPAVEPIYSFGLDPTTMRAYILQKQWQHGAFAYSDINFMLLGIVLERVLGAPLNEQTTPRGTTFAPSPEHCAATEYCTWRNRLICGEVHDENAFAFGGASGHAGLFGTVDAVLDFAYDLLNHKLLPPEHTSQLFVRKSAQRALGWEIKYDNWTGGQNCSQNTIGHTGFTGTGLWIDPEREIAWTLLTNRVHPTRHFESGIMALRREVGEAIIGAYDANYR
ncbi:MAG: esterase / lipase [Hyphomonadaceae bacterium]|nr:MAG: esterase / lipase [Hyphomonadaceae bacterium]